MSKKYKVFLLFALGVLSGFGPFVTDMYLPSLPFLPEVFGCSLAMVQLGLTASMVGMALGQLVIGPLSDKYGRKGPLVLSMWVFILSSLGCVFAPTIEFFIVCRLVQGLSAAGGIVISKSVTTDSFEGASLAKAFALVAAVHALAPILAPVVGSVALRMTNWQGIFIFLTGLGVLILIMCMMMRESLPESRRNSARTLATFKEYVPVLRDNRLFRLFTILQFFIFCVFFAYIAASPHILQTHFQLSEMGFGGMFALNAVGLGVGNFSVSAFKHPWSALKIGIVGTILLTLITGVVLLWHGELWMFECAIFLQFCFMGMIMPTSTALGMATEKKRAGTASAVLGSVVFLAGGLVSPLVGLGDVCTSTGLVFMGGCLLVLATSYRLYVYRRRALMRRGH